MAETQHTAFLEAFPGCADLYDLAGGLEKAFLTAAELRISERSLRVFARFASMPSPVELDRLTERIREDYNLTSVILEPSFPEAAPSASENQAGNPGSSNTAPTGSVLYGRAIKQKPVPMSSLTMESGKVTVEGDVISVQSRSLQKRGGAVLSFDITDRSNSVRVTRFLRSDEDQEVLKLISENDHLIVQGEIGYSKFDDDMILEPRNIMKSNRVIRPDMAEE